VRQISPIMCLMLLWVATASAQIGSLQLEVIDRDSLWSVMGARATLLSQERTLEVMSADGIERFDSLAPGQDTLRLTSIGYHKLAIPITIKQDTLTTISVKMQVLRMEFDPSRREPYQEQRLPRNYVDKNTRVTYSPLSNK
jgi:hypothetical protein